MEKTEEIGDDLAARIGLGAPDARRPGTRIAVTPVSPFVIGLVIVIAAFRCAVLARRAGDSAGHSPDPF